MRKRSDKKKEEEVSNICIKFVRSWDRDRFAGCRATASILRTIWTLNMSYNKWQYAWRCVHVQLSFSAVNSIVVYKIYFFAPSAFCIQYSINIILYVNSRTDLPNNIKNISFASFVIKAQRIYYSFFLFFLENIFLVFTFLVQHSRHYSHFTLCLLSWKRNFYLLVAVYTENCLFIVLCCMHHLHGTMAAEYSFLPKYKIRIEFTENELIIMHTAKWKVKNNLTFSLIFEFDTFTHHFFPPLNCEQCLRRRRRRCRRHSK